MDPEDEMRKANPLLSILRQMYPVHIITFSLSLSYPHFNIIFKRSSSAPS
jgi:hypothetical protein